MINVINTITTDQRERGIKMKDSTGKGTILMLSRHRKMVLRIRECMPRVTIEEYYAMLKQVRENQPSALQEPAVKTNSCLT